MSLVFFMHIIRNKKPATISLSVMRRGVVIALDYDFIWSNHPIICSGVISPRISLMLSAIVLTRAGSLLSHQRRFLYLLLKSKPPKQSRSFFPDPFWIMSILASCTHALRRALFPNQWRSRKKWARVDMSPSRWAFWGMRTSSMTNAWSLIITDLPWNFPRYRCVQSQIPTRKIVCSGIINPRCWKKEQANNRVDFHYCT